MPTELELRDIHLPDPISLWPPALGWWLIFFGLIILMLICVWLKKRWLKKQNSAKVLARKELIRITEEYQQKVDAHHLVEELSSLYRRVTVSVFPRIETASLTGDEWLKFLEQIMNDTRFTEGVGQSLISAPYKKDPQIDADALLKLSKDWIEALP